MKILVADDNPALRHLLADALGHWGYEVLTAADGLAAAQLLGAEGAPRLALLDWAMPGLDGVEVCRQVRQCPDGPYTYLLLLTGRSDRRDLVSGLEAGADDYLVKPVDLLELRARLHAARRVLAAQEQLLVAQEALRHQATHDPLTGLGNRAAVREALDRELVRGEREGRPVGVVLADVDHFKRVNDTYGHEAGDAVLREVSRRMTALVRPYDALGRYGGEEFLLVLPDGGAARALDLAERLREGIGAAACPVPGGQIQVTASFGVASTEGSIAADADTLVREADAALYVAKRGGRNRVELSSAAVVD